MTRSSSRRSRPASAAGPPLPATPPVRLWLFRLSAMMLGPLVFLLLLELGLRLAGIGHPMSFFLPMRVDGKACLIENDRFGWRFFGPEIARAPFPFVIPQAKPPNTIRVFVFGESAAYGDPQPEFGLPRILAALLEGRYPGKHFEVVNGAMTAINSHVILPIARDCAPRHGDFWVIYMGNNEVVGPFGSGTVFGPQAANLSLVRASVALKATRLGQVLESLIRCAQKHPLNQSEWGGMAMFLRHQVRQDDPRMAAVYHSFEQNLNDIIEAGVRSGAKVVVSTVARNLKDCGPFASVHRSGLAAQELSRWDNFMRSGIRAQEAGRDTEAIDAFQAAARVDDTVAELHFRWGQSSLALGQDAEASRQFTLACDQDALRFRADGRINEIIRQVASRRKLQGVQLADSESALARQSPHRLPGAEFFYDHVHLDFEGNYLLARALAETVASGLGASANDSWPTADDCARRLGWNDSTRCGAEKTMLGRLNDPPFRDQVTHRQQYQRLLQDIQQLQPTTRPEVLRQEQARTQTAAAAAPDDWILQRNLARLQRQTGDLAGAVESCQRVVRLLPQCADAWQDLGVALEMAKRDGEAIPALLQSARLSPGSVAARNTLAELYLRQGRYREAAREFQRVLRVKPYWGPAHLGLGKTLEAMGKTEQTAAHFDAALKNRIRTPDSYNSLARFAVSRGWWAAAVTNFADSLQLYPSDPEIHVALGLALVKLGKRAEAQGHYVEAVRLQPNFAEAHFCMGLELGKSGDTAGAATQFAETIRLKPELIEARLNLGIALANQHLDQEALAQFEEVLRRDPSNQVALARAKVLRADLTGVPPKR